SSVAALPDYKKYGYDDEYQKGITMFRKTYDYEGDFYGKKCGGQDHDEKKYDGDDDGGKYYDEKYEGDYYGERYYDGEKYDYDHGVNMMATFTTRRRMM
ncbi:hypothetical protein HK102_011157, partial [Quaeritorhiza haematococci]